MDDKVEEITLKQFFNLFPPEKERNKNCYLHLEDNKERFRFVKHFMPEINNVKLLYHYDYYDGPLTGLCEFEHKNYYFSIIYDCFYDENFDGPIDEYGDRVPCNDRFFVCFEMPKEFEQAEEEYHKLFVEYFGSYTCYDGENNKRKLLNPTKKGKEIEGIKSYAEMYDLFKNLDKVKELTKIKKDNFNSLILKYWFVR